MGNVKMVNRQRTRERRTARILLPRGPLLFALQISHAPATHTSSNKIIGSFLISGCCDCDIPDCTASNYKETSHCTSTSVVLGIPFFFQRFGARNRSLKIREIQSFRLKKIYLHILSNSVNMCLKKALIKHDNKSHFAGAGFVVNNF